MCMDIGDRSLFLKHDAAVLSSERDLTNKQLLFSETIATSFLPASVFAGEVTC